MSMGLDEFEDAAIEDLLKKLRDRIQVLRDYGDWRDGWYLGQIRGLEYAIKLIEEL